MGSLGFQHSRQIGVFLSGDEGVFLQALELILSQNLIKPQTTDNQVQITT